MINSLCLKHPTFYQSDDGLWADQGKIKVRGRSKKEEISCHHSLLPILHGSQKRPTKYQAAFKCDSRGKEANRSYSPGQVHLDTENHVQFSPDKLEQSRCLQLKDSLGKIPPGHEDQLRWKEIQWPVAVVQSLSQGPPRGLGGDSLEQTSCIIIHVRTNKIYYFMQHRWYLWIN